MPNFVPWIKQRHHNAAKYRPCRPESSFKGTVNAMLNHHFKQEENWLVIPEITLRTMLDDRGMKPVPDVPQSDDDVKSEEQQSEERLREINEQGLYDYLGEEDEEVGDISLNSQGGAVQGSRSAALRPDFGVSHGQSKLFSDRTHLYVEVKNGEVAPQVHTEQISNYVSAIAASIPEDFTEDVVLMLVDAGWTYIWRITPTTTIDQWNLWSSQNVEVGKTCGHKMGRILREVAGRV